MFRNYLAWLRNYDLTGNEIKEASPETYQAIQDAIDRLDRAFINEDFAAFQDSLDRIKSLYTEALSNYE